MIIFNQVTKRYVQGGDALKQVTFSLDRGEMAFLTGHSGAGKSSLLKLTSLIERANYGQIIVNDIPYNKVSRHQIPYVRRNIGIVFQNPQLLSDRKIFDNVALPLIITDFRHSEIKRRVRASLDKVGLLHKENCYPNTLSGGEQQRVGIARAIVHKPPLLLADEPTGNLDPNLSNEIMNLFCDFNRVGVTTLVASHDLLLIASLNHRILTLEKGCLV